MPRPLEAVCLKAMATAPADRYPSVRDLLVDLMRWNAGEPVSVYRERPLERLSRWSMHHRTAVRSAIGALLMICMVAMGAAVRVETARRQERAARHRSERSRRPGDSITGWC